MSILVLSATNPTAFDGPTRDTGQMWSVCPSTGCLSLPCARPTPLHSMNPPCTGFVLSISCMFLYVHRMLYFGNRIQLPSRPRPPLPLHIFPLRSPGAAGRPTQMTAPAVGLCLSVFAASSSELFLSQVNRPIAVCETLAHS